MDTNEFEIQSIHIISKAESKKIHLLAITTNGIRLYFTHQKDALRMMTTYQQPITRTTTTTPAPPVPNALELIHVRLPPTVEASSSSLSGSNGGPTALSGQQPNYQLFGVIHAAYYDCGALLAAKTLGQGLQDDRKTVLLMTSMDLGDYSNQLTGSGGNNNTTMGTTTTTSMSSLSYGTQQQQQQQQRMTLVETSATMESDGHVYAIAEASPQKRGKRTINEITETLCDSPRRFLVLTDKGVTFFKKQRPVDVLQQLLMDTQGDINAHRREFESFFERYGRVQSCAMCLAIICGNLHNQELGKKKDNIYIYIYILVDKESIGV